MSPRRLRAATEIVWWASLLALSGCQASRPAAPADAAPAAQVDPAADEARQVAEATLGRQAEVLAHGDLALTGLEQVLAVNRFSNGAPASEGGSNPKAIFVTRAAILEKNGAAWSEVLLCDEHLKNPHGYLSGPGAARVTGWQVQFQQDSKQGLELRLTPADESSGGLGNSNENSGHQRAGFEVRWNKSAKRYQTFDQSHERYLSEVPSLEAPESTLK